jgi:dynein heavy chain, axonemal
MIIREVQYLDRIGVGGEQKQSKTILNVALQERDYIRYVDNLKKMLREYHDAVGSLKKVERMLLKNHIKRLDKALEPGINSLNWNSLGIHEFISKCRQAISKFKDTKGNVTSDIDTIEQKVKKIEEVILIKDFEWERKQPMDLRSFQDFFEKHKQTVIEDLVKDYESIGSQLLKKIEENACPMEDQKDPTAPNLAMGDYFSYWERRIFNALTKMTIRAYATLKALFNPPKNRDPLFKIEATYNHPEVNYNPSKNELDKAINKIRKMPLECGQQFVRWKHGYCILCEKTMPSQDGSNEEVKAFTFFNQLDNHPVIVKLYNDINDMDIQLSNRIEENTKQWTTLFGHHKLWDQNARNRLVKSLEKNPSTSFIESQLVMYEKKIEDISERNKEKNCFFFNINNSEIIKEGIKKVQESIKILKEGLFNLGNEELLQIVKEIEEFQEKLSLDIKSLLSLKILLGDIQTIKGTSMVMEFRIADVQEKFRMLEGHGRILDEDMKQEVDALPHKWEDLMKFAKEKDYSLIEEKKQFAKDTSQDVLNFKGEIQVCYEAYLQQGPGADIKLVVGFEELKKSLDQIKYFNKRREELVLAEKLFNLPISSYPHLIAMEEKNKVYSDIYSLFEKYQTGVKEYSIIAWSKLDIAQLNKSAEDWEKAVKKMASRFESETPYIKLREEINGFYQSLPLIMKLKQGAIQERHWEKIMKESGKNFEINLKTITLAQVFELELHNYKEIVDEVVTQANHEAKNDESLREIERIWKFTQFEIKLYKRGAEEIGVLRGCDDIKETLEDNILNLQTINNSRYVGPVLNKVRKWEKSLNLISDVIDVWFLVQRKWMYLESIFAGTHELRTQLEAAAKRFDKTHTRFKRIMEATVKNRNVFNCCHADNRLGDLKNILSDLENCQKSLSSYLESKRFEFPRFYFISDDELLFILGSSDPDTIQRYLMKLFDNCKALQFSRGKQVNGMKSDENEEYKYYMAVKPDGAVEEWMGRVDDEMKRTLHLITKEATFLYAKEERVKWILQRLGMVSIIGAQIWWTFAIEDVFRRVKEGDKHAMKKESSKQTKDLDDLIDIIRTDLDDNQRNKINTLIKLDVHGRDIVDSFVRDSILDSREFEWESQVRFYWDKKEDDVLVRQCTGVFTYGYEYQGLNGRLVITPLTDRCIMTLTTALTFKLGGSPAGPAGTGKTETVKDLAKSLAIRCVVNNCGEGLDYQAMGKIYAGLVQTGFWGCFDEFNRINPEVLSVVAAQIKTIQIALNAEKKSCELLGTDMRLIPTVGIFVTMNPGYAGRSELPDNLKALFRPVTMVVPDMILICEIMLMSEGFNVARILAKKMTVLYKLSKEQLSKQHHYDFGLRALKSVLVKAGALKREFQKELGEDVVLMRALRDMNMPKFVFDDVPLFQGLIKDLFPALICERVGHDELKEKIIVELEDKGYRFSGEEVFDDQVNKVVQLFETMETRHTTMVVGPTGGGKTVIIFTLKEALKLYDGIPVKIDIINSKSITVNELYGVLDNNTRDWTEGLFSKIFKEANEDSEKREKRWILFDSDVDTMWVESMNSVMDDNRILTLANNDRIRLGKHCALLFEVGDLQYASPATISRCGMVYVDPKNLGYEPYYEKWAKNKGRHHSEAMAEALMDLFKKYVPYCIGLILEGVVGDEIEKPLDLITPRTNLNMVRQLTVILDAIIPKENPPTESEQLESYYILALIWSLGGGLLDTSRDRFDEFIKKTSGKVLVPSSLFLNKYDAKNRQWMEWSRYMMSQTFDLPVDRKFSKILVPTVDTVRYAWLLKLVMDQKLPCMFVGDSGTAKTVTMESHLNSMNVDKFSILKINFSSRTTSMDVQRTIEENIDKRSVRQYGPPSGRKLVICVDDLNMPKIDLYGTQQPIALLKFLIEKSNLYQRGGDLERREIIDTQVFVFL